MNRVQAILSVVVALSIIGPTWAQPVRSDYPATPFFVETFQLGGNAQSNGRWEIDPDMVGLFAPGILSEPTFVSQTPGGLHSSYSGSLPVENAPSGDNSVMMVGNASSSFATHEGNLLITLLDPDRNSGLLRYATLTDYRVEAEIYVPGADDVADRCQAGLMAHAGSDQPEYFRPGVYHNTSSEGGGPGFGVRGMAPGNNGQIPPGVILSQGRWITLSVMTLGDQIAVEVDLDLNGSPDLYSSRPRNTSDRPFGAPGIFVAGVVSSDEFPVFIDEVRLYAPDPPLTASLWQMFE